MFDYVLRSIQEGGWTLMPIYISCVLGWYGVFKVFVSLFRPGTTIDRLQKQSKDPERLSKAVSDLANKNQKKKSHLPPPAKVLFALYDHRMTSKDFLFEILDEQLKYMRPKLETGLQLIGVMATIAPLLGLLGTVIGMVGTFEVISYFGTSNPALMAGSIATALVTTQNGILVAMPLLIAHILLKNRAERIEIETTKAAHQLILYYGRKMDTNTEIQAEEV